MAGMLLRRPSATKTARGKAIDVETLNPETPGGKRNLEAFLTPPGRHYTISGLGAPEEENAINWHYIKLTQILVESCDHGFTRNRTHRTDWSGFRTDGN